MPSVRGHHHLAIQVKDLAGAVRFYGDVLGLKVVRRWPHEDGRPGERSVWLSVGQSEEFVALEACDVDRLPTPSAIRTAGCTCWLSASPLTTETPGSAG